MARSYRECHELCPTYCQIYCHVMCRLQRHQIAILSVMHVRAGRLISTSHHIMIYQAGTTAVSRHCGAQSALRRHRQASAPPLRANQSLLNTLLETTFALNATKEVLFAYIELSHHERILTTRSTPPPTQFLIVGGLVLVAGRILYFP